jgi:hypothetical protein
VRSFRLRAYHSALLYCLAGLADVHFITTRQGPNRLGATCSSRFGSFTILRARVPRLLLGQQPRVGVNGGAAHDARSTTGAPSCRNRSPRRNWLPIRRESVGELCARCGAPPIIHFRRAGQAPRSVRHIATNQKSVAIEMLLAVASDREQRKPDASERTWPLTQTGNKPLTGPRETASTTCLTRSVL